MAKRPDVISYFGDMVGGLPRLLQEDEEICREMVEPYISQLPEDQQKIIKLRSGWDGEGKYKTELARELYGTEKTREVDQLEWKARRSFMLKRAHDKIFHEAMERTSDMAYVGEDIPQSAVFQYFYWRTGKVEREIDSLRRENRDLWDMFTPEQKEEQEQRKFYGRSVDELELCVRSADYLAKMGCKTIGDVYQKSDDELMKGLKKKSYLEVKEVLKDLGEPPSMLK